jgi:hypothetical protein
MAFAAAMLGDRRKTPAFKAVQVVAGQYIDHPGHRIRPIDRRGTGLEQLDLPDHRQRQHIEVEGRDRAANPRGPCAAAVDEHQRAFGAKAAQRQRLHVIAAIGDKTVRDCGADLDRPLRGRRGSQHADQLDLPLLLCGFGVDDLDRIGAGELALRDPRPGDDDRVVVLALRGGGRCDQRDGRRRRGEKQLGVEARSHGPVPTLES